MQHELENFIKSVQKPLLFASKNNFSNLNKIKNLESAINDCILKFLSKNQSPNIEKLALEIKNQFIDFENLDEKSKKDKVTNSLKILSGLSELCPTSKAAPKDSIDSTKEQFSSLSSTDVRYLKGVGPKISSMLNRRSVFTVEDLLFYSPRRYDDRTKITSLSEVIPGNRYTVVGTISSVGEIRNRKSRFFKVVLIDNKSRLDLIWFNFKASYLRSVFKKNERVIVNGEIAYSSYQRSLQIVHPTAEDVEIIEDEDTLDESLQFNRIVPIYPLTDGLTQRRLRKIIYYVLDNYLNHYKPLLSDELIKQHKLMNLSNALREVHFPANKNSLIDITNESSIYKSIPHRTVIFFEFFVLELGLTYKKKDIEKKKGISFNKDSQLVAKLINSLPFTLTQSQKKVISEIENDMSKKYPMNRLLQGDVGSGKTIVALTSILTAIDSGYQAVFMVPTEILAEQHYKNLIELLKKFDVNLGLLKSALPKSEKSSIYRKIKEGKLDIVVGTHALIEEVVDFHNLGLVVIDEQHRFGVLQRAKLVGKAKNPDVLIMTATPIPRTLAITVYGDLDVSVIDELPPNRKNIETTSLKDTKRNRESLYKFIRKEIESGRQAYVVCPFIDESENPDFKQIKYALKVAEDLQNEIFPDFRIGLLHGKMSSSEKEESMNKFLKKEYDIIVSTTVIEVGVDVSNATIMVIENAERFGLSQLHQLRGRIGRGEFKSACFLVSSFRSSEDSVKRLSIITQTNNGFRISEADLELRGPGDFLGTKQSGLPSFNFANLLRDSRILDEAREAALDVIRDVDNYSKNEKLFDYVVKKWGNMLELSSIS